MRGLWVALAGAGALAFGGAAWGQSLLQTSPGFHYFNKAGASLELHQQDLRECVAAVDLLDAPTPPGFGRFVGRAHYRNC